VVGNLKQLIVILFLIITSSPFNKLNGSSFSCSMLHDMLAREELKRFLHLDVNDGCCFYILDAEKYLNDSLCYSFENRRVLIVHNKAISRTQKRSQLTIGLNNLRTRNNKDVILNFSYDYEGIVGEVTYDKRGKIKKILVWEH
jgi:hypothetical protein